MTLFCIFFCYKSDNRRQNSTKRPSTFKDISYFFKMNIEELFWAKHTVRIYKYSSGRWFFVPWSPTLLVLWGVHIFGQVQLLYFSGWSSKANTLLLINFMIQFYQDACCSHRDYRKQQVLESDPGIFKKRRGLPLDEFITGPYLSIWGILLRGILAVLWRCPPATSTPSNSCP